MNQHPNNPNITSKNSSNFATPNPYHLQSSSKLSQPFDTPSTPTLAPPSVGPSLGQNNALGAPVSIQSVNDGIIEPDSVQSSSTISNTHPSASKLEFSNISNNTVPATPGSTVGTVPGTPATPNPNRRLPPEMPSLQNIVSTVNLGVKLDLKKIATQARNAEYNPKRFAAVIMRIRNPRTTALIFSTGKMVCTGAKSIEFSRHASRKFARIVQKLGYPEAKFLDFQVQNMVGSVDVKFPIRLEGLVIMHSAFSNYEPEIFPGLIYRMVKPKIVLLIFVSGKVVLTGAKREEDIQTAYKNIYPVLSHFRKQVNK